MWSRTRLHLSPSCANVSLSISRVVSAASLSVCRLLQAASCTHVCLVAVVVVIKCLLTPSVQEDNDEPGIDQLAEYRWREQQIA